MDNKGKRRANSDELDYLIIGGGPAGLQLAYFLSQSNRRYLILERSNTPGSFFKKFPRSRSLISFNKKFSVYSDPEIQLRWDWNSLLTNNYELLFPEFSRRLYPRAEELLKYLREFAERYELAIQYNTKVRTIAKEPSGRFIVEDAQGNRYAARRLIVATGVSKPYIPPVPGIEHAEGYESVSMRRGEFEDQRVLIIGKGNSGFEFAEHILESAKLIHLASPNPIRMAWKTRHAGDIRAHYTRLMDAYQLKLLHGILDCVVESIEKRADGKFVATVAYTHAQGERERIVYDRIVRAAGFRFDPSIFSDETRPALTINNRFPDMTSGWESTNVPGLFFAGTLMQVRDFRRAASPFIDGFRYNVRTLYHLLEQRYHRRSLPCTEMTLDPADITRNILERVCRTSALWAQFGYLCDALVVEEQQGAAKHFFELPVDYVHDSEIGRAAHYYTITFEWGKWEGDVFNIERHPTHHNADISAFLHPIIRRFCKGQMVSQHHLLEDLLGMYCAVGETGTIEARGGREMDSYHLEEHEIPLRKYFEGQLGLPAGVGNISLNQH